MMRTDSLRVLRLTSVFEPKTLTPAAVRYDPIGGMQNHTAELTRCLDDAGMRQVVVTSRLAGPAGRSRFGTRATIVRTGVHLAALRQVWAPPALSRALGVPRPDVVHAHSGEDLAVLPIGRAAASRHRCPLVVTLHCSLRHTVRRHSARGMLLHRLGGEVERRVLASADAVITLTPSAAARARADGVPPERVHVIPSGYAPRLFADLEAHPPPDPFPDVPRPRIAYVGRLGPQKKVSTLIRAFADRRYEACLLVVGDGPDRSALQRQARALGDRVRFTGFVPHDDVPAVLAHVDLLVLPSAYEELGSVLVEAMAAGVPVVASRVGGIPDLVEDDRNGVLVPPGDARALARALDRLMDEPDTLARFGKAARQTAEDYAWPALAARVADVYRRVVSGVVARR